MSHNKEYLDPMGFSFKVCVYNPGFSFLCLNGIGFRVSGLGFWTGVVLVLGLFVVCRLWHHGFGFRVGV